MDDFIETPRLIIKSPDWSDFEAYYGLLSDPEVMRYIGKGIRTQEETRENLQKQKGRNAILGEGALLPY